MADREECSPELYRFARIFGKSYVLQRGLKDPADEGTRDHAKGTHAIGTPASA